jgi:hypothetical protein
VVNSEGSCEIVTVETILVCESGQYEKFPVAVIEGAVVTIDFLIGGSIGMFFEYPNWVPNKRISIKKSGEYFNFML